MEKIVALKNMPISFPGLFGDWEFNPDPIALHVGHGIYWYGIILALAMLAGYYLALKHCKRYGISEDDVMDMLLAGVPASIVGARLYYVIFYLDLYRNPDGSLNFGDMIAIWDGGIAIYGAVIGAAIAAFFVTRHKKMPFGAMADLGVMGLLIGQCIGRWANFINREAFGGLTELPWRMRLWTSATEFVEVHPTFLYESLWNLAGLLLVIFVVSRGRRFDGENTWFYFLWYGMGRLWIEGLRTDSLYLFDWTLMGEPIRVSQALSFVMIFVSLGALAYVLGVKKPTADGLYVNQLAAAAEQTAEQPEAVSVEEVIIEQTAENAMKAATAEATAEQAGSETAEEESDHGDFD